MKFLEPFLLFGFYVQSSLSLLEISSLYFNNFYFNNFYFNNFYFNNGTRSKLEPRISRLGIFNH